jgi:hypothetical protein
MDSVAIRDDCVKNQKGIINYPIICIGALIVVVINTIIFCVIVLDPDTIFFIKGNLDKLKALFHPLSTPPIWFYRKSASPSGITLTPAGNTRCDNL